MLHSFKRREEMFSGPHALEVSKVAKQFATSLIDSDRSGICITDLYWCERAEISWFTTGLGRVKPDEK